jgi:hypothetical protein
MEDCFTPGDEARPHRRAVHAFSARLNAAGLIHAAYYFTAQFKEFLERDPALHTYDDYETVELCEQLYDYFKLAGSWIKTLLGPDSPITNSISTTSHMLAAERWNLWKQNLTVIRNLATNAEVRMNVLDVLMIMEHI